MLVATFGNMPRFRCLFLDDSLSKSSSPDCSFDPTLLSNTSPSILKSLNKSNYLFLKAIIKLVKKKNKLTSFTVSV
jgi:hypothetical protein